MDHDLIFTLHTKWWAIQWRIQRGERWGRSPLPGLFLPTHGWQANGSVLPQACLSVVCLYVCNARALRPNGDRWTHDFFASWQGFHLATPGTNQHRNRSSHFRAVADLVDPPYVPASKRCEIGIWLLWNTIGKSISHFQNPQKNLTSDDVDGSFLGHESENGQYRLNGCS